MKITKITIENFKMFKEKKEINFSDMNFLIGENNTGKTSVLEAIDYLINGPKKDVKYKNLSANESEYINIEIIIEDQFLNLNEDCKKYESYIYEENNKKFLKIKRTDEKIKVTQNGKEKTFDENNLLIWNSDGDKWENPSGIDKTFKSLFDVVLIYAKQNVDDVVSFDSGKLLGKLIKANSQDFFTSDEYEQFKQKHNEVFVSGANSLKSKLDKLSTDISSILKEQWGDVNFKFNFELLDHSNHLKNGSLLVEENGKEHELDYKGSGMQRATMLALIQLFSNVSNNIDNSNIILCIDEPELNLHPKAQEKLIEAIHSISDKIQIIISTHSPYILKSYKKVNDKVYVFRNKSKIDFEEMKSLSILPFGPTFAEIQYFAYNLTPTDLHNELYGYLEGEKIEIPNTIKKQYIKLNRDGTTEPSIEKSLQEYIRHQIHHPENSHNIKYTEEELQKSIDEMILKITN